MTTLVVVGPTVISAPSSLNDFTFLHPKMNPQVTRLYSIASRVARESGVDVLFPNPTQETDPLGPVVRNRLECADAVFAVLVGKSDAIPAEASLALSMNIPLLVAAVDRYFTDQFEKGDAEIISAESPEPVIKRNIVSLFGEGGARAGRATPESVF